jgi:hypothetical protein
VKWGLTGVCSFFNQYSAILDKLVPQWKGSRYKKDKGKGVNDEERTTTKEKRLRSHLDIASDHPSKRAKEKSVDHHPRNLLDELPTVAATETRFKDTAIGDTSHSGQDGVECTSSLDPSLDRCPQTALLSCPTLDSTPILDSTSGTASQSSICTPHADGSILNRDLPVRRSTRILGTPTSQLDTHTPLSVSTPTRSIEIKLPESSTASSEPEALEVDKTVPIMEPLDQENGHGDETQRVVVENQSTEQDYEDQDRGAGLNVTEQEGISHVSKSPSTTNITRLTASPFPSTSTSSTCVGSPHTSKAYESPATLPLPLADDHISPPQARSDHPHLELPVPPLSSPTEMAPGTVWAPESFLPAYLVRSDVHIYWLCSSPCF